MPREWNHTPDLSTLSPYPLLKATWFDIMCCIAGLIVSLSHFYLAKCIATSSRRLGIPPKWWSLFRNQKGPTNSGLGIIVIWPLFMLGMKYYCTRAVLWFLLMTSDKLSDLSSTRASMEVIVTTGNYPWEATTSIFRGYNLTHLFQAQNLHFFMVLLGSYITYLGDLQPD